MSDNRGFANNGRMGQSSFQASYEVYRGVTQTEPGTQTKPLVNIPSHFFYGSTIYS